jgi:hypothetical protein
LRRREAPLDKRQRNPDQYQFSILSSRNGNRVVQGHQSLGKFETEHLCEHALNDRSQFLWLSKTGMIRDNSSEYGSQGRCAEYLTDFQ